MLEQFLSLLLAAGMSGGVAHAQPAQKPMMQQSQTQDRIYGSQLMTSEERDAYRAKMRAAKTQAERNRIRADHHDAMQARAKERGVTLPDRPPASARAAPRSQGNGMGPGSGMGRGPGSAR
jgi:hypothetical protein